MPKSAEFARSAACRPPTARKEPHAYREHGHEREDPYHWMSRRDDPEMLAFLRANNRHAEEVMRHTLAVRERLFGELCALTPTDEGPPPYRHGPFRYRLYHTAASEYPILSRWKDSPGAAEEVLLDTNALAVGHEYFALEGHRVAPNHSTLAYTVDTTGDHRCLLRFRDLGACRDLPECIDGVDGSIAWAKDGRTLFYIRVDPVTFRPAQVWRHVLGTPVENDALVHDEDDEAYRCLLSSSRSEDFIFLICFANDTLEVLALDSGKPLGRFVPVVPRRDGCEYEVDHCGDRLMICTNAGAPDGRVVEAPLECPSRPETWREVVAETEGTYIEHAVMFRRHIAMIVRREGQTGVRVVDRQTGESHDVHFEPLPCEVWIEETPGVDTTVVRIAHTSLVTPVTYYDYDMATRERVLIQTEAIPGYRPGDYVTGRLWATSHDGVNAPVSFVYRRDRMRAGGLPVLLFGYGAYGTNIPLYFDQSKLALLDRGFVYAMAHVRGGSELGGRWARAGRLARKPNTFHDFIACAEQLVAEGIGRRDRLFAESLSAGGLLLGAVINMRPDLFRGVVALAPFVDLLTTMSDPDCPLTAGEYAEWGDPRVAKEWEFMRGYSPYDNIPVGRLPYVLATASLNDSQVQYWEPAKWVARLRDANRGDSQQILQTNLSAGHSGTSGRLRRLRDLAYMFAFLLDLSGIKR